MDETDPMPSTLVSGSEVANDQIVDIKPEIRDDFYYFQNLVFKVMSFHFSKLIIPNRRRCYVSRWKILCFVSREMLSNGQMGTSSQIRCSLSRVQGKMESR